MKFDFIIGNPPYQEESEGSVSSTNAQKPRTNIFHLFQEQADGVCTNVSCLIYPGGRWIHQSGKGLKSFGKKQLNDRHLSKVVFYPRSRDIFPATDIPDGITIVVKDRNKDSSGFDYVYVDSDAVDSVHLSNPGDELIPLNPKDGTILQKIDSFVSSYKLSYLHDSILPRSLFAIESTFVEDNPSLVRPYEEGSTINPAVEVKLFTNDRSGAGGRSMWFVVQKDAIKQNQKYIAEWQVVVSSAHPGGQDGRDSQLSIIDNMSAFGRARVALKSFTTQIEAENFYRFVKCKLVRFAFLMTDESLSSVAKRVPDLGDYTSKQHLIDFNGNIDEQMYQLIGLTPDEKAYIESHVKEMT